jgi:hypothetical protein
MSRLPHGACPEKTARVLALLKSGKYSCDKAGNIYSNWIVNCHTGKRLDLKTPRKLKASPWVKTGYWRVAMLDRKGTMTVCVHRVIALNFFGNFDEPLVVNHKNSNRADNRLANLEVITRSENSKHGCDFGNIKPTRGALNGMAKLSAQTVLKIRALVASGLSHPEAGRRVGVKPATAYYVCNYGWKNL